MDEFREKGFKDGEDDNIAGVDRYIGFGKSVDKNKLSNDELKAYSDGYEDGFNSGPRWQWQD